MRPGRPGLPDGPLPQPARKLLRRALGLAPHLKRPASIALGATVLATAARLLGPLAVRDGIDEGISAGDELRLTLAAAVFLGLLGVQYAAQRGSQFLVASLGERYLRSLRSQVFRQLMRLDMPFYERSKAGVLVSRMTSDVEAVSEFAQEGAVQLVTNLLTIGGVAAAMAILNPSLAIWVFVIIGVLVLASFAFQRLAGAAYREVRLQIGRVLASLQEGITGVRVVQAFTQEDQQAGMFGDVNEAYFRANMRAAANVAWYFPLVAFLRVAGVATVLLVGGRRVIAGEMTFGSLVVFLLYLDWFFQPIMNLSIVYNQLQSALAGMAKLFDLFDTEPTIAERPGAAEPATPVRGEVALRGVRFGYDPGRPVLHDVDLVVAPGERVAVVGETGAGKSTIAKLVLRFYDPQAGEVSVDGHDLRELTFASRAANVVLIPQDGYLFNATLRDNIRYARPGATDDEIWDVLATMGASDWARELPERLDTLVRERGSRFSAGERQLVALARALLVDPAVIVLDEATANLDPGTEARVERALAAVLGSRTAVVIAHRLRTAERADRVVMIDRGRIVAEGTHAELTAAGGGYAALVAAWERGTAG